ncbi:unnamed protein product [Brassicogethes aeneus]|uniref:Protein arginine N-methyltransferase n=1 Tax=Brassicogethes aeneus TaxID=1431903 RepID=A0A9P0AQV4_BRAAE|nr:unnamed protein product [Brassicogethes aeneus]
MLFRKDLFFAKKYRAMSVFIQKLNPITGINDWIVQNEDYDYHQEVARASFADMLHDTERNQLYEKALIAAIDKMHLKGKKANVLDIGTGTGLLSMMAARNGADSIVACEAFKPMSECAKKIIKLNGYEDKIKVIHKRSTELTVGKDCDLTERCNILVTEVFDTELIGEGALSTFSHAHKTLLEEDCIVVPESATIFAQVIECPLVQDWNKCKDIFDEDGKLLIAVPKNITYCAGSSAVHDIQLSQMPTESINTIVSPIPVLRFDWSGRTPFVYERSTINSVKAEASGKVHAIFMWWELQMDTENKIILSCAPKWAHPLGKTNTESEIPWRDHWMQAVYYLAKDFTVEKGEELNLISCHDEYSLWFNISKDLKIIDMHYLNPICECGLHISFSRTRIGQINDNKRNKKYISLLQKHVSSESTVLILSDGFFTALAAAKMGAKKVYVIETSSICSRVLQDYINYNKLENVTIIRTINQLVKDNVQDINLVISEPYFTSSILPWDSLLFIYLLKGLQTCLTSDAKVFPQKAIVKAVCVQFKDLHKIRSPLVNCEGFLMDHFDKLIEESSDISDDNVEAQPLWEYPCVALTNEQEISMLDILNNPTTLQESSGCFQISSDLECNGIAIWIDWVHDGSVISTGPTEPIVVGEKIEWDIHTRQGVCLFPNTLKKAINYDFKFDFISGNILFKYKF